MTPYQQHLTHLRQRATELALMPLDTVLLGLPVTAWLFCIFSEMGE